MDRISLVYFWKWYKVRREEVKDNPILKGARYVFLKNTQNLTKKQQQKKQTLELANQTQVT